MNHFKFSELKTLDKARVALAILLLLCLLPFPYGFFSIVRLASFIIFGCIAYTEYQKQYVNTAIFYAAMALLFQPFFKIYLERGLWNVIDIIMAIVLLVPIIKKSSN